MRDENGDDKKMLNCNSTVTMRRDAICFWSYLQRDEILVAKYAMRLFVERVRCWAEDGKYMPEFMYVRHKHIPTYMYVYTILGTTKLR